MRGIESIAKGFALLSLLSVLAMFAGVQNAAAGPLSGTWQIEPKTPAEAKLPPRSTQLEITDERLSVNKYAQRFFAPWSHDREFMKQRIGEITHRHDDSAVDRFLTINGFGGCNYFRQNYLLMGDGRLEHLGLDVETGMFCGPIQGSIGEKANTRRAKVPAGQALGGRNWEDETPASDALGYASKLKSENGVLELIGDDGSVVGRFTRVKPPK